MKSSFIMFRPKVFIISGLVAILFFCGVVISTAGIWLQREDTLVKANAILVLAGNELRPFYAADLYKQGYASVVYISKPEVPLKEKTVRKLGINILPQEEIYRRVLIQKGVPQRDIRSFGKYSISTVEEAEAAGKLFSGKSSCTLLVVTSPYHVARTRMIFRDKLRRCQVHVVGTTYEPFPKKWWTNQHAATSVISELVKILFYKGGGAFYFAKKGHSTS